MSRVKPPKVEAKPNIDGASIHVEASLYVDSSVVPLDANEVDTAQFFSKKLNDLLNWLCRQANRAGFTIIIRRSNLINPMLQLLYRCIRQQLTTEKFQTDGS